MEIFKAIQGYEQFYEVSNFGRVKSLPRQRKIGNVIYQTKERFLRQRLHDGYLRVNLCDGDKKMKTVNVHLLVINAFVSKIEGRPLANHKDRNRQNNNADNLEWVNSRENVSHGALLSGKKTSKYTGVMKPKLSNSYYAKVKVNKETKHIGVYKTEEEAYAAVLEFHQTNNIQNKYL